ncbi:HAMP domain-containing sensor histidine kinase [Sphingomonas sp.]|uniref:sensor histidine kinase n=1 Tax=Sphingomonas sp. TaxID=28214 RepID=UPI002C4945A1|nr:HAMP domain-containing sensor histidine kinase [Sphingomonas sp.]HTG39736.1 HAMP domain-containing sensor histidine kinase [Sphingomonas sp.]
MNTRSRWPHSLSGQIALLVAVALFVAQAINFALLYRERRELRFTQIVVPTVTRMVDSAERLQLGRVAPFERPRARVRLVDRNPVPPGLHPAEEIEVGVRKGLAESGIAYRRVVSGIRNYSPDDPRLEGMRRDRARRLANLGAEVIVGVELRDGRWLALNGPWPRTERGLVWQLIAQTLILYAVVLLPVLWIGRRVTRPLNELTSRARAFAPGGGPEPMAERGPGDIRALIAAYNELSSRVSAMLDEKDRMLGAIGHDLRTPLAALRVRIESVEDDADRQRMADIVGEMHRTLEDILSLARLGRPSEPVADVDMAALVDAVVEDFRDLDHKVDFVEAERIRMRLRPSLMRRAVRNLIENAIKYAGAAEVQIVAEAHRVIIAVCDRGPGLPPDKLDAVFDPFVRLESSRNRETGGIGLGLALARAIVRDAGGRITLENRAGGGLIARIELTR